LDIFVRTVSNVLAAVKLGSKDKNYVKFVPGLPEWKQDAINSLSMGVLNKLFLQFDKCYWEEVKDQYTFAFLNHAEKANDKCSLIVNLMPSHNAPILTLVMGGTAGKEMERRSK
jgi:monoamine oxidase